MTVLTSDVEDTEVVVLEGVEGAGIGAGVGAAAGIGGENGNYKSISNQLFSNHKSCSMKWYFDMQAYLITPSLTCAIRILSAQSIFCPN